MAARRQSIYDQIRAGSPVSNEFRRLLMKIQRSTADPKIKSILVTSAMLSEGKSTVCSLLGITAALQDGLKTLIVDTDLRRPSIHKFFNLPKEPGISDILVDGFSSKEAIRKTDVDRLDIITCGTISHNAPESFDAEAIGYLIDEMKFFYDLILIDSAPVLPVSDPLLLAPRVDRLLLVVKAGSTDKEVVKRALKILDGDRDKIFGIILNNMTNSLPHYYNYSYYGYSYGSSDSGRTEDSGSRPDGAGESTNQAGRRIPGGSLPRQSKKRPS